MALAPADARAEKQPAAKENSAVEKSNQPYKPVSEDIDFSAIPGVFQPLASIAYLISCIKRLWGSSEIDDHEGRKDAHFKLSQLPFLVVGSVTANIALLRHFDFSRTWYIVRVAMGVSQVFGFICSILEGIYETYWFARQELLLKRAEVVVLRELKKTPTLEKMQKIFEDHRPYFYRHIPGWEERFILACQKCEKTSWLQRGEMEKQAACELAALALRGIHEKYFRDDNDAQRAKLERRIRPWCYAEIRSELLPTITKLTSENRALREEGMKKTIEIFDAIEIQAFKKQMMHVFSLAIAILTFASLVLMSTACPWTIPLVILIASNTLVVGQYILYMSLLDNRRWTFTPHTLVPSVIRNLASKVSSAIGSVIGAVTERLRVLRNTPQRALPPPEEPLVRTQRIEQTAFGRV